MTHDRSILLGRVWLCEKENPKDFRKSLGVEKRWGGSIRHLFQLIILISILP
jgi:hypothetical protein